MMMLTVTGELARLALDQRMGDILVIGKTMDWCARVCEELGGELGGAKLSCQYRGVKIWFVSISTVGSKSRGILPDVVYIAEGVPLRRDDYYLIRAWESRGAWIYRARGDWKVGDVI